MMTINELSRDIAARLTPRFGASEASWMCRMIMENVFARSRVDLIVDGDKEASTSRVEIAGEIVNRVLAGEPLQYILGYETFMGMRLNVTPDVLIPRPETEQLVELIAKREGHLKDLDVLDAGTGSGCIAIALSRWLPFANVTGIDISARALEVARANAAALYVKARWVEADMLHLQAPTAPLYDLIVSNPPYVLEREKADMQPNVLEHEPPGALFVPDDDGLRFYKALESYAAAGALRPAGRIYFELNPLTADALADYMRRRGWCNVELLDDERGCKRFLRAVRSDG